jgi:hypothetical protein
MTVNDDLVLLLVYYVGDKLIETRLLTVLAEVKGNFLNVFDTRDLGEVRHVLNILVKMDRKKRLLWLNQGTYAISVVEHFGMRKRPSGCACQ